MNIPKMYVTYIIKPIEDNIKELQGYYYSKNIFKYPHKRMYKKYIDIYSKLLQEKLKYLEKLIDEELEFHEKTKK